MKMEQTSKTAPKDVKNEAEEQELLGKLIKRGIFELQPKLNKVGIRYMDAEETWKDIDSVQVKKVLENLERKGVLVPKLVDRAITCPDCGSPEVYSKYACPKCNSINVEYTELIEHMKCGYMGLKSNLVKGASLVCPECQAQITDEALQLRVIGNCYQCEKCGNRFDAPEVIHFCQQCKRSFTHREAKYVKIYAYKITDEIINRTGKELPILDSIGEVLRENGFDVRFHAELTGISGVRHSFDIVAKRKNALLIADISLTGSNNDAVSLLGKKMDVNPTEALLIDLSDRDELLPLGKVYGITILKGGNEKELKKGLRSLLAVLLVKSEDKENLEKRLYALQDSLVQNVNQKEVT
jgi:predicted Zn finger-like uncharacterized protein